MLLTGIVQGADYQRCISCRWNEWLPVRCMSLIIIQKIILVYRLTNKSRHFMLYQPEIVENLAVLPEH